MQFTLKFARGFATFVVLCLAAYGAFTLLKRPPQIDIPEGDRGVLADLGIPLHDTRAADSGLSAILNVEGVAPVGASTSSPFGGTGSSAPPSFLAGHTTSSTPPSFMTSTAPRVAVAHPELQESPRSAVEVPPPPNFFEPAGLPVQTSPIEIPSFDTPTVEVLIPPLEALPVSATESPPPESWNGPASGIAATPPPSESLQTLHTTPRLIANTPADTLPPLYERIAYKPIGETIHRVETNVRKIDAVSVPVTEKSLEGRVPAFSSPDSVPLAADSISSTRYTQASSKQPLMFEPIRPAVSPTAPVVAFAPPKRLNPPPPPEQQPTTVVPVVASPVLVNPEVKPIGASRLIENVGPPVVQPLVQPTIRGSIEQFVQSQRQLAESGDPDNIRQAFIALSRLYELDLADAERALIQPILDMLARRVVYARDTHILESPYRVKPGETIGSIAEDFNLTPALLRKINGLGTSHELPAGTTLKVLYGQFDARISVKRKELTLLLGGLYAGRFSFSLANESLPVRKGEDFYVTSRADRMLVLNNGWVLATDYARNATIIFADRDAREICDILSEQSVIVVE